MFTFLHLVEQSNAAGHPVPFLLLENVEALLNRRAVNGGYVEADIVHIVDRLESMGYAWAYRTIDAAGASR